MINNKAGNSWLRKEEFKEQVSILVRSMYTFEKLFRYRNIWNYIVWIKECIQCAENVKYGAVLSTCFWLLNHKCTNRFFVFSLSVKAFWQEYSTPMSYSWADKWKIYSMRRMDRRIYWIHRNCRSMWTEGGFAEQHPLFRAKNFPSFTLKHQTGKASIASVLCASCYQSSKWLPFKAL